ncbi:MAG: hypothetical protein QXE79_02680 [Candidatus Bathyarchaeia archaeon]
MDFNKNNTEILEHHLQELTKIIEWLNGFSEGIPFIPSRIEMVPIVLERSPILRRIWRRIHSYVDDLNERTKVQGLVLKLFEFMPIGIALMFISLSLLNPHSIFGIPVHFTIFLFGLLVGSMIVRESIAKKIKKYCLEHETETSKVRQAIQDIILYLCNEIRTNGLSTANFKMKMRQPEYFGIRVIRYSMLSRSYIVIPSVLGALSSRAKAAIKLIAQSLDAEIISVLQRIPANIHVTLILSKKEGKGYEKLIATMKKSHGTSLDVIYSEIGKEKLIILDGVSVWKCRGGDWSNLQEIFAPERDNSLKNYLGS